MGQYAKALEYYEQGLRITRQALGPDHPVMAATLRSIGSAKRDMGAHAEALEHLRAALAIHRAALGADSDNDAAARIIRELGGALLETGDVAAALTMMRDAHRILLAALGTDHDDTQRTLAWLRRAEGRALQAESRTADAALKLEEALRLFTADVRHGAKHARTKAVAAELVQCRASAT
jgi:tetratricopeptide (TPR) repeat protein